MTRPACRIMTWHARLPPVSRLMMHMDASVPGMISLLAALTIAGSSLTACAAGTTKRTTGEPANFEGVWTARQCDPRAPERECGIFTLYLTQDGERICGEHFVATTGLARLDEGDPGTVLGQARGSHAVIVINSTRNGVLYLADMQHTKDEISWRLVGPVTESRSGISPIIPAKLSLMKDSSEGQQKHLHSVRSAPCSWPYGSIVN